MGGKEAEKEREGGRDGGREGRGREGREGNTILKQYFHRGQHQIEQGTPSYL